MNAINANPSQLSAPPAATWFLTRAWHAAKRASPALAWSGAFLLFVSLLSLLGVALDHRLFQGVSVWHKPWKFQVSTAAYFLTLAYFLAFLPTLLPTQRLRRVVVWLTIATGFFEVIYISWQGGMGMASHYNVSSPFYGTMYTLMGIGAVLLTATSGLLAFAVFRSKVEDFASHAAMRLAVGLGLAMTCVLGIVTGGVLGERTRSGGHWVGGTANDALGLAVFNWSRDGGDLRVAHFFALHALQVLPLFVWAMFAAFPRISQAQAKRAVWALAAAFSLLCVFTLMQALRGLPFLAFLA